MNLELELVKRELHELKSRMYREISLYGKITENIIDSQIKGVAMSSSNFEVIEGVVKPPTNTDWVLDWKHRSFRYKGKLCTACPAELSILECLLTNPGVLMTTKAILGSIDSPAQPKIVDVYMCKIRAKIEKVNKGKPQPIANVWGRGWYIKNESYPDIPDNPILPPIVGVGLSSRWTPTTKNHIGQALKQGQITKSKLMSDNIMSEDEFKEWFE